MRNFHRNAAVVAILFALYIALTGIAVQTMDLAAILRHAPASDPTMQSIRSGINGPPNFQVIRDADYAAAALPDDFDYGAALRRAAAISQTPDDLQFVEFRMRGVSPVSVVAAHGLVSVFDLASGQRLGASQPLKFDPLSTPSLRGTIKNFHRLRAYGPWAVPLDTVAGLILCTMILTGLLLYAQLLRARMRMKRRSPFWSAGGLWRSFHRSVAICAALFLAVIAVTGTLLSISSVGVVVSVARQHGERPVVTADLSSPLSSAELVSMLHRTLAAYHADHPAVPIKALRLRSFAGMAQGVVVGGRADDTQQWVFNAVTGRPASLTEPNYPAPGQTFGWQADETLKRIHRGDYFGLTGRWISLLSGFSLLYVAISGIAMYGSLWKKRAKRGRRNPFWT